MGADSAKHCLNQADIALKIKATPALQQHYFGDEVIWKWQENEYEEGLEAYNFICKVWWKQCDTLTYISSSSAGSLLFIDDVTEDGTV